MKLKTILATAVVTAAAGFAATGASAADREPTHVSFVSIGFHNGDRWYEGNIYANEDFDQSKKCADNRKVKVFRIANGPDVKVGVTTSNGSVGSWTLIHPDNIDGAYYAKAPRTDECQADRSDELVLNN
jgi:hypothetical protein